MPHNMLYISTLKCHVYTQFRGATIYTVPEAHVNIHNIIILFPNSSQIKARRRIAAVTSMVGENTLEMSRDGDNRACVREQVASVTNNCADLSDSR